MKLAARNARRAVIRENPIGVLDISIGRFQRKLDDIDENSKAADAARKRLANRISTIEINAKNECDLAMAAQRQGKSENAVAQHAVAQERWLKSVEPLKAMYEQQTLMQEKLHQARDLCAAQLEDLRNQKSVMQVQLEALQEGASMARRFKQFFSANPELEMLQLSVEEIERQTTEAEAEIDQVMRLVDPMLQKAELQKSADSAAALARLNSASVRTECRPLRAKTLSSSAETELL